jgi:hypothetical protein
MPLLGEKFLPMPLVHHKLYMDYPGIKTRPLQRIKHLRNSEAY